MFNIDGRDKRPIYKQIVDRIILLVATNVLVEGDKLPSIRNMAQDLGINANTVARAYTELEYKGIIETISKSGTFVKNVDLADELTEKAEKEIYAAVRKFTQLGMSVSKLKKIMGEAIDNVTDK